MPTNPINPISIITENDKKLNERNNSKQTKRSDNP